jgi:arsenate reductase-like glutaredoxin family protein
MAATSKPTTPSVQVFGRPDSAPTRAALRFFRERRFEVHFVDLGQRAMAPGELRRFVERLGPEPLLDTAGRAYREGGLAYLRMDRAEMADRIGSNQKLLRLPLVRFENQFTAGAGEATWKAWLAAAAPSTGAAHGN